MKHLVDVDEEALERARRQLGTPTIKATVNAALRVAAGERADDRLDAALDTLASAGLEDRAAAWR